MFLYIHRHMKKDLISTNLLEDWIRQNRDLNNFFFFFSSPHYTEKVAVECKIEKTCLIPHGQQVQKMCFMTFKPE